MAVLPSDLSKCAHGKRLNMTLLANECRSMKLPVLSLVWRHSYSAMKLCQAVLLLCTLSRLLATLQVRCLVQLELKVDQNVSVGQEPTYVVKRLGL